MQFPQTYTARRTGVSEIVPLYRGHPATISIDKLGANVAIYYSNAVSPSSRDGSWWLLSPADTEDFLSFLLPASAQWVAVDVLSFAESTPPRRGVKYTITAAANPHQHQDFASGAWSGAAPTTVETPSTLGETEFSFSALDLGSLWQNEARSTPVTAFGQEVLAWDNTGQDALTHVNHTTGPTYQQGISGHPSLRGDDVDSFLLGAPAFPLSNTQPFTWFQIGGIRDVPENPNGQLWMIGDGQLDGIGQSFVGTTNFQFQINNNTASESVGPAPFAFYNSGRKNAEAQGNIDPKRNSINPEMDGANMSGLLDVASGSISFFGRVDDSNISGHELHEFHFWLRRLTDAEITEWEVYAMGTYGIIPRNFDPFPV